MLTTSANAFAAEGTATRSVVRRRANWMLCNSEQALKGSQDFRGEGKPQKFYRYFYPAATGSRSSYRRPGARASSAAGREKRAAARSAAAARRAATNSARAAARANAYGSTVALTRALAAQRALMSAGSSTALLARLSPWASAASLLAWGANKLLTPTVPFTVDIAGTYDYAVYCKACPGIVQGRSNVFSTGSETCNGPVNCTTLQPGSAIIDGEVIPYTVSSALPRRRVIFFGPNSSPLHPTRFTWNEGLLFGRLGGLLDVEITTHTAKAGVALDVVYPAVDPAVFPQALPVLQPAPFAAPASYAMSGVSTAVGSAAQAAGAPSENSSGGNHPPSANDPGTNVPGPGSPYPPGAGAGGRASGSRPLGTKRPPRKGEREGKMGARGRAAAIAAGLVSAATEAVDLVVAAWKALPDEWKTRIPGRRTTPWQMAKDLYAYMPNADAQFYNDVLGNFAAEQGEDAVFGRWGRHNRDASRRAFPDSFRGFQTGPADTEGGRLAAPFVN